jgi:hypothetical protein
MSDSRHALSESGAAWVLRAAILLHALGVARALFTRTGTSIGNIALMDWGTAHDSILFWEKTAATVLVALALSLFIRPTVLALLGIFALVFAEALAAVKAGGFAFFAWTPYASFLRYLAPLALLPLVIRHRSIDSHPALRRALSSWMLRIGLAVVFVTHGIEALKLHPGFIDLIIGSGRVMLGLDISEEAAVVALRVIFVVDLIVAALVMIRTWPPLLAWLAFWGLVTALSRPIAHGFPAYPEVLLRASHFLAPLAIWLLARDARRPTADNIQRE